MRSCGSTTCRRRKASSSCASPRRCCAFPDDETADRLIADKLRAGDWASHLGDSQSLFVNASTWGLMLTGRIVRLDPNDVAAPEGVMRRVVGRIGEPVVRTAMRQAMRIMGHQFVMGRTMKEALDNSLSGANRRYRYTFDMLGEAALTTADATRYFDAYRTAIGALAARVDEYPDFESRPSISVKLSAMHPRFERAHRQRVHARTDAATGRTVPAGARCGHRADARHRGIRAARTDDGTAGGRLPRARRSPAGTASASRCRPTRSARCRC